MAADELLRRPRYSFISVTAATRPPCILRAFFAAYCGNGSNDWKHHSGNVPSPSRPGELHPEPLTDPDLSLSTHPARAPPEGCRLLPRPAGSSCCQLTKSIPTRVTHPLPSTDITPSHRYYEAVRP